MNTEPRRNADTQDRAARRHTHTQHRIRVDRMLVRAARREIRQEVAAW